MTCNSPRDLDVPFHILNRLEKAICYLTPNRLEELNVLDIGSEGGARDHLDLLRGGRMVILWRA